MKFDWWSLVHFSRLSAEKNQIEMFVMRLEFFLFPTFYYYFYTKAYVQMYNRQIKIV